MTKLRVFFSSIWFQFCILIYAFIVFIFTFFVNKEVLVVSNYDILFTFLVSIYGLIAASSLVICKNTVPILSLVIYFPFMFGDVVNFLATPLSVIIPLTLASIGAIAHIIIYKPRFRLNVFAPSIFIYIIALSFGGIGSKSSDTFTANYEWYYTIIMLVMGIMLFILLSFINSDLKIEFSTYAKVFTIFAYLIILEVIVFIIWYSKTSPNNYFLYKVLDLGWGCHNSVAITLLMTLPFPFYLASKNDNKILIYSALGYGICLGIFMTLSRGGIATMVLATIPLAILCIIKTKMKKKLLLFNALFFILVLLTSVLLNTKLDILIKINNVLFGNTETINTRKIIWESAIELIKDNPIFGIGIVGSMNWKVDAVNMQFAHNTLLEMFIIGGFFGGILMIIHLLLKYAACFYKVNYEKVIIAVSFAIPEFYGLFDVTYLSCYTALLIISMFMYNQFIMINFNKERNNGKLLSFYSK